MIVGTGVDLADTRRIRETIERFGTRFLERVYTPGEIAYCDRFRNRAERYAARFAAKEAAFKALGTGWRSGVQWLDVEVARAPGGKPELVLRGRAQALAHELGVKRSALSLSHVADYAMAQVIFESGG